MIDSQVGEVMVFAEYFVTRDGRVFSCSGWRGYEIHEMAQHPNAGGYSSVGLKLNGRRKHLATHRLVALAFLPPPPTSLHEICHGDGNRQNPHADNLRWGTRRENFADRDRHGNTVRGERMHTAKLTERDVRAIREALAGGVDCVRLGRHYGVYASTIWAIGKRKIWRHVR